MALGLIFTLMLAATFFGPSHANTPTVDSTSQTTLLRDIKEQLGDLTDRLPAATSQRTQQTIRGAAIQQKLSDIKLMLEGTSQAAVPAGPVVDAAAAMGVPLVTGEHAC